MSGPQALNHLDPRRYEVRHVTAYTYEDDVTASFGRACLRPRETHSQRVLEHTIDITPEPDVFDEHVDIFGNYSHYLEIGAAHRELTVTKRSVVEVAYPEVDLAALNQWTVAEAAAALPTDPAVDPLERAMLLMESELVDLGPEVDAFAQTLAWPDRPLGDAIVAVTRDIYRDFAYTKGATTTKTTLPELLATRAGVCQDFAHLAVGVFRSVGLPARYVSGYIETAPPPGQVKLAGSDATHAWAAVLVPGGSWIDLDPTNDHLADSRYIMTAWGRDFRDVSPLKGVIFTESPSSSLSVGVDVIRLEDES
ncbi:MAG: transglutaminase family protein [Propionibacteriaceae bacterium]|nr:transglutaminase family protein [Propionibacteriaceae bacterium]